MSKTTVSLLFAAMALSACTWPGYGNGGMDEAYRYERAEAALPALTPRQERAHTLGKVLDGLRRDIDAAWMGQEGIHRPAGMTMIEKQWNRAAREWAANMLDDAEANLGVLSTKFRTLREELRQSLFEANQYQPASI